MSDGFLCHFFNPQVQGQVQVHTSTSDRNIGQYIWSYKAGLFYVVKSHFEHKFLGFRTGDIYRGFAVHVKFCQKVISPTLLLFFHSARFVWPWKICRFYHFMTPRNKLITQHLIFFLRQKNGLKWIFPKWNIYDSFSLKLELKRSTCNHHTFDYFFNRWSGKKTFI